MSIFVGRNNGDGPIAFIGIRKGDEWPTVTLQLWRADAEFVWEELGRALGRANYRERFHTLAEEHEQLQRRIRTLKGALTRKRGKGGRG